MVSSENWEMYTFYEVNKIATQFETLGWRVGKKSFVRVPERKVFTWHLRICCEGARWAFLGRRHHKWRAKWKASFCCCHFPDLSCTHTNRQCYGMVSDLAPGKPMFKSSLICGTHTYIKIRILKNLKYNSGFFKVILMRVSIQP